MRALFGVVLLVVCGLGVASGADSPLQPVPATDYAARWKAQQTAAIRVEFDAFAESALPADLEPPSAERGAWLNSYGVQVGDLDRHFGALNTQPGQTLVDFGLSPGSEDRALGITTLRNGNIATIGTVGTLSNGQVLGIAYLRPDGRLDTTRLDGGRQTINVTWPGSVSIRFVKARAETGGFPAFFGTRLFLLGELAFPSTPDGDSDFLVLCLEFDGLRFIACPAFGTLGNGLVRVAFDVNPPDHRTDIPKDLSISLSSGTLVLAGSARVSATILGPNIDFALARLDIENGDLDLFFGGTGKLRIAFDLSVTAPIDVAYSVHVRRNDNRVLVGGDARDSNGVFRSAMAQLLVNGSLDTDFCPPGLFACTSPASHRSGRRLWIGDEQLYSSRVNVLLGGDTLSGDSVVVRERRSAALSGDIEVSALGLDGVASYFGNNGSTQLQVPVDAKLYREPALPGPDNVSLVVAAYGRYSDTNPSSYMSSPVR